MTTYIQPLRRVDGRWDMTSCTGSTNPHPIGYCRGWKETTAEELEKTWGDPTLVDMVLSAQEEMRPFRDKFHDHGHETASEAFECYEEYLLNHRLEFRVYEDEQHKCGVCGNWGSVRPVVDHSPHGVWLCSEHANADSFRPLYRSHR